MIVTEGAIAIEMIAMNEIVIVMNGIVIVIVIVLNEMIVIGETVKGMPKYKWNS